MTALAMLDDAFTSTIMDLRALRHTDIDLSGLRYYSDTVDFALGCLCDALEENAPEALQLAHDAYRQVLGLESVLELAETDNRRTREKLDLARGAVADLLAVLETIVRPG